MTVLVEIRRGGIFVGVFVQVSDDDSDIIKKRLHLSRNGYARTSAPGANGPVSLHRIIANRMGIAMSAGQCIDHIDRDKLNCTRENLRAATPMQNQGNKRRWVKSGSKGVFFRERTGKFEARIKGNGKSIHLGTFSSEKEAADAYDKAAIEIFGEFAATNMVLAGWEG